MIACSSYLSAVTSSKSTLLVQQVDRLVASSTPSWEIELPTCCSSMILLYFSCPSSHQLAWLPSRIDHKQLSTFWTTRSWVANLLSLSWLDLLFRSCESCPLEATCLQSLIASLSSQHQDFWLNNSLQQQVEIAWLRLVSTCNELESKLATWPANLVWISSLSLSPSS